MRMENACMHIITPFTRLRFDGSYKCFSTSTKYTSFFLHDAQEGSKLMATNSLEVAALSFLEIDDLPNGFEVLRDHHSVKF